MMVGGVEGGDKNNRRGVMGRNCRRESRIVRQSLQVQQRSAVHAQGVLKPCVICGGIHERHEPQLADPRQPAKLGRVNNRLHARRDGDVDFMRDADQSSPRVERLDFRKASELRHGDAFRGPRDNAGWLGHYGNVLGGNVLGGNVFGGNVLGGNVLGAQVRGLKGTHARGYS